MKKYVFGLLTLLILLLSSSANAQQGVRSHRFTIAGPDSAINLINTAIAYHKMTWAVTGTASACTVALDTSANGSTWTSGGAITGQNCTSNGSSSVVNVSANYVRINMTALTLTAGSSVTVTWDGYTSNPSGGGSVSCSVSGGVGFETSTDTLGCDSTFTFDSVGSTLTRAINTPMGFGPKGQLNLIGDGPNLDCDGFGDPCLEYLVPSSTAAMRTVQAPGAAATSSFQEVYTFDSGSGNSSFFTDSFKSGTAFSDTTFTDNGYMNVGGIGGATAANSGQFEVDSPNSTVTMRKGHSPFGSSYASIMHIQFDSSNNILIEPASGSLTKIGAFGGSNFATFGNNGQITVPTYSTTTNCADSAGAAACGSAAAGSFVIDAAATSVVVSTSAVTANSEIFVQYDSSLGTRLGITCNTTVTLPAVTARTASTSFTVTVPVAPSVNPACYSYHIVN